MSQILKHTRKKYNRYIVLATLIIIIAIVLIAVHEISLGTSSKKEVENFKSDRLTKVEKNLTPAKFDLTSTQNGLEIKLTKFMATKKKFIFDYQFKLDDDRLQQLLDKELAAGVDYQNIFFSLFAPSDRSNDLVGGGITLSTFRIEGDTFYGRVNFTFNSNKMPDDTNLILQISELSWEEWNEHEGAEATASETGELSTIPPALKYEGEWHFDINYQPLRQTAKPYIKQVKNIEDIKAESDALQTTVKFTAPIKVEEIPDLEIYQDGVKIKTPSFTTKLQGEKTQFELSLDMSVLDEKSVYKIQVNSADIAGQQTAEIGTFSMQNKSS
ncbi:hypothetical protein RyT2_08510 [Pseudolactococcus yaeyamensis]